MNPLVILLIGMAVVIGGVLVLRLHAFLALVIAALIVAWLTPGDAVRAYALKEAGGRVVAVDVTHGTLEVRAGRKAHVTAAAPLQLWRAESPGAAMKRIGELTASRVQKTGAGTLTLNVGAGYKDAGDGTGTIRLGAQTVRVGDVLVHPLDVGGAEAMAKESIGQRVAGGFGSTAGGIGILIAMAAIIGKCLLDSGAADRIVYAAMKLLGEKRAPQAFVASGFVLGIPVFFDTVFYLMIPLGKAMRARTGRHYLLYILSIVAGATMAHSLVPPTPGPLFVAGELGVDLGLMMLGGCVVGALAVCGGYAYARWADKRWDIPLRDSIDESAADLAARAHMDQSAMPPLALALAPIVLPVVLIAGSTVLNMAARTAPAPGVEPAAWVSALKPALDVLGNKNVALIIAAVVALVMLAMQKRTSRAALAATVQQALASGGLIILITAAGGAFGAVLRQTDIAGQLGAAQPAAPIMLLPMAFAVTALVRTAQGSATVAMITAVGVFASFASPAQLGYHPLYLALAIGCGSKPIAWMNDSGFWVIGRMSGMTEAETLKTSSAMMIVMAIVGLAATMLGATLLPLR